MGKVKGTKRDSRRRLVREVGSNINVNMSADPVQDPEISGNDVSSNPTNVTDKTENPFASLNISFMDLNTSLNDDSRSAVSVSKSNFKGKNLNKHERRRLRRQNLLENITSPAHSHKKKKKNKRRNKSSDDEQEQEQEERPPLEKISMSVLLSKCRKSEEKKRVKGILKTKNRHKKMLKDMESIHNIWKDQTYMSCPSTSVSGALQEIEDTPDSD